MSQTTAAFQQIDLSDRRRIFAAGDIHGRFDLLETGLESVGYDAACDALILVGDLINRGHLNALVLDWISRENVYRVLGNHEVYLWLNIKGDLQDDWIRDMGAGWFCDLSQPERIATAAALHKAPVALEIQTPHGRRVGFTHADCPAEWNWIKEALEGPPSKTRDDMFWACIQSRKHGRRVIQGSRDGAVSQHQCTVSGIEHVFHGHTIFYHPFCHDNRSWIDTGAYSTEKLTVIEVDAWLDTIDEKRLFQ